MDSPRLNTTVKFITFEWVWVLEHHNTGTHFTSLVVNFEAKYKIVRFWVPPCFEQRLTLSPGGP